MRGPLQLITFVVVLSCLELLPVRGTTLFKRRYPTPALPEDDHRVRRHEDAGAHTPEQVHLSYAGPGAVTVSWVTWPHEDDVYLALASEIQASVQLGSARKLRLAWLSVFDSLERHRHRRRHRRRHRPDGPRDPDPAGNCDILDRMDLESAVQWGLVPGNYTHEIYGNFDCYSTTAYLSGALHHVVIGDREGPLPASTDIFYRVGDPGRDEWSEEMSFTMAPPLGEASLPYRLGLIGDLGQTEHSASTLEHMAAQDVDSVMFMGDLSYADGYQPRWDTWGRFVAPHTSSKVWMYTEGNHEIEPSNVAPDFLSYSRRFRLPHHHSGSKSMLYYSYEVAGVHILMLGSYTDFEEGSEQYAWLQRDLASVDRQRTPWVVAGLHAPWYNSNYNHYGDGERMRRVMESVLYEHGVDAVMSGHVHAYERSFGVYDNDVDPCGPLYINIGDGGNREGLDFDYYRQPQWSAIRDPSYGHAVLDFINATHAVYHWHRNQDGVHEIADEAVLERDPACRKDGKARLQAKLKNKKR